MGANFSICRQQDTHPGNNYSKIRYKYICSECGTDSMKSVS